MLYKEIMRDYKRGEDFWGMWNTPPDLINDTPDSSLFVYMYNQCGPSVNFFDLKLGKEIAQAESAQMFVKYLPAADSRVKDLLFFVM